MAHDQGMKNQIGKFPHEKILFHVRIAKWKVVKMWKEKNQLKIELKKGLKYSQNNSNIGLKL